MANFRRKKNKAKSKSGDSPQENMMDDLAALQEFRAKVAPELREMLLRGASSKEMVKKFEAHATARTITIAVFEPDSAKALAAAKDILDRSQGKAVEVKKLEHSMSDLSDKELDALLLSEKSDLDAIDADDDEDDQEVQ
jgi:hypothetical protein